MSTLRSRKKQMGNSKYQRSFSTKKPHATSRHRLNKKRRLNICKEFTEKAAAIKSDLNKWYSNHATSEEHKKYLKTWHI